MSDESKGYIVRQEFEGGLPVRRLSDGSYDLDLSRPQPNTEMAALSAVASLARAGIVVRRADEPWLELYMAPGFPELTRNQLIELAAERGR